MSTTNSADRYELALLIVAALVLVAVCCGIAWGEEVSIRNAGGVVLSATPQAIGANSGRIDLIIHNDTDSPGDAYCGYDAATLSTTPGPSSGDKLKPGEGKSICVFADRILYCLTDSNATFYYDESRMVTPTPTP